MADTVSGSYGLGVYSYVSSNGITISQIANSLGVSPEAVAGNIAEELADRAGNPLKGFGRNWADLFGSTTGIHSHADFIASYNYFQTQQGQDEFKSLSGNAKTTWRYFEQPAFGEWGPGSIKVGTAIDYLERYLADPQHASDPLNLSIYQNSYDLFVADLASFNSDVSIKISEIWGQYTVFDAEQRPNPVKVGERVANVRK